MSWFSNRLRRGMTNRAYEKICREVGSAGGASAFFAVAIAIAVYPKSVYGSAQWDQFNSLLPKPVVDPATAAKIAESWVDNCEMSWDACVTRLYGEEPMKLLSSSLNPDGMIGSKTQEDQGTDACQAEAIEETVGIAVHCSSQAPFLNSSAEDVVKNEDTAQHARSTYDQAGNSIGKIVSVSQDVTNQWRQSEAFEQALLDVARLKNQVGLLWFSQCVTLFVALAVLFGAWWLSHQGESIRYRVWTDSKGRFSAKARLIGVDGNKVHLQKMNGKVVSVDMDRLSRSDQQYLGRDNYGSAGE